MTETGASARELYDRTASRWMRDVPSSLSDYTARPTVLSMCEPIADARVLDLGCGEGYCARRLARAGAARVLGVDISEEMVALARQAELATPLRIGYRVGSATDLSWQADASFDVVVAVFLFNYLDCAETRAAFVHIARVLRPGGRFVFAVPHPSFPFLHRGAERPFYFDAGSAGYLSARDARMPGRIWRRDGTALDVQMCHKTLQDYFEALRVAGFTAMPEVRELAITSEILEADREFFEPLIDLPLHLAIGVER